MKRRALVSPTHGNFIVNEGGATAADIRRLTRAAKRRSATVSVSTFAKRSSISGKSDMATLKNRGRASARRESIAVEGNKNSALPLLAACLLSDEECVLTNVPRIRDVEVLVQLMQVSVRRSRASVPRR